MNLLEKTINFFRSKPKDQYLEYLKRSTGREWTSYRENEYWCYSENFYMKITGEKAECTREANWLAKQTPSGPFCGWFKIPKNEVHIYL